MASSTYRFVYKCTTSIKALPYIKLEYRVFATDLLLALGDPFLFVQPLKPLGSDIFLDSKYLHLSSFESLEISLLYN